MDPVGIAVGLDVGGGHTPQSLAQVLQSSPLSHTPLPQLAVGLDVGGGHAPQSPGQVLQSSPLSHSPLPQMAFEMMNVLVINA